MSWLVYTSSYLARYSYNANVVSICDDYAITNAVAGLVGTFYFAAYGTGQIINGIFCKKYNKRYIISAAMLVSSAMNLIIFLRPDFSFVKYLWFVNGAALSVLWSSLICLLGEKLDDLHLKKAIMVLATPVALGTCFTYLLSSLFNVIGNYRLAFLLGFAATFVVGILWFAMYDKFTDTGICMKPKEVKNIGNGTEFTKKAAFTVIVVLSVFAVFDNFIKDGLNTWVPNILKETYGFTESLSITLTLVLPILGVFGATMGVLLNKYIKNYIALNGILFTLGALCLFGVTMSLGSGSVVPVLVFFGTLSLLMHSINCVITSIAPLQMREYFSSGTLAGILDGCCYIGSAISAYGLGALSDNVGWKNVFIVLLAVAFTAVIIAAVYFAVRKFISKKRA